jgi:hypothetical protein
MRPRVAHVTTTEGSQLDSEQIDRTHVPADYEKDRIAWNLPLPRERPRPPWRPDARESEEGDLRVTEDVPLEPAA